MEDHLADERVLSLFLRVIADDAEFDLARLAALKVLQIWDAPTKETHARVGRHLASVMPVHEDVLVQQWTAIAAQKFANVPEVFAAALQLVADPSVDVDVRHNCLSVIERVDTTEKARVVLRSVADDDELGSAVRRFLSET